MDLTTLVGQLPELQTVTKNLKPNNHQLITGLSGSAKTVSLAAVLKNSQKSLLIVTESVTQMDQLADDLSNIVDTESIFTFPVEEVLAAEVATSSPESRSMRILALQALREDKTNIVIAPLAGLRRLLPEVNVFESSKMEFKVDGEVDLANLPEKLTALGYMRDKLIAKPGEFAIRGDIIDIYPLNAPHPIRIELFDTEIDSMRYFEPASQRSIDNVDSFTLLPATDLILTPDTIKKASKKLKKDYDAAIAKLDEADRANLTNHLEDEIALYEQGKADDNSVWFMDYFYPKKTTLFDYAKEDTTVVFDDYSRLLEVDHRLMEETDSWRSDMIEAGRILPQQKMSQDARPLMQKDKHAHLYLSLFQKGMGRLRLDDIIHMQSRSVQPFFSQMPLLKTEMDRWKKQNATVVVMIPDEKRINKIDQTFHDFEIQSTLTKPDQLVTGKIQIVPENLQSGFELPQQKLTVITEKELFNAKPKKRPRRQTLSNAERIKSYEELKPGDYVVHVNHGIGRYVGMQTLEVDGVHQDYITIEYRDNGKLFIPVTQLNLVQKYVSSEAKTPKINKLGGSEWQKTKHKVASKIEDIADDLLDLYAERESEKGFAFSKDNEYQREFDAAFPYPETPDQIRSINEIKHDMEQPKPMDRLLVGDVGFGKTEVALRAAFKAIQDNKQVAFLVPTTILAQQHYETMLERFADFPVNVGILSRFSTTKQAKATIQGLKDGSIDIVVGTHRLLSKDVSFKDLGLLIIDEEQRFGVKHKERLKQLKTNVDVLTLTATPIPRTLHMSLLGVRDLSVIETPPTNRYPIQTYVMEQNAGAVREAIERELDRKGQVFYLHNRVNDIERTVDQIKSLVPDARVAYAHGQMTETQLENVLYEFLNGDYDVLVTTTIIETGVDMPNVNTMVVENADRYGLSQLYQLRGRIGRSSRIAYGYFMYQPNKVLTEVSEQRLKAIKDFTELGAGFKIAMRDLTIRGAGDLLGKQQHGFIDSVGFDLYNEMLQDAVMKKRGKKQTPKTNAEVSLQIEAYLPSDYIEDQQQKIEMYKRIRQMNSNAAYLEIQADLIDRFGEYPTPVQYLLDSGRIKAIADQALVEKIHQTKDKLEITISSNGSHKMTGESVFAALAATDLKANVALNGHQQYVITLKIGDNEPAVWLNEVKNLLEAIKHLVQPKPKEVQH